jgi:hypothetical protein
MGPINRYLEYRAVHARETTGLSAYSEDPFGHSLLTCCWGACNVLFRVADSKEAASLAICHKCSFYANLDLH